MTAQGEIIGWETDPDATDEQRRWGASWDIGIGPDGVHAVSHDGQFHIDLSEIDTMTFMRDLGWRPVYATPAEREPDLSTFVVAIADGYPALYHQCGDEDGTVVQFIRADSLEALIETAREHDCEEASQ